MREPCDDWYCNDLCSVESEAVIAVAVAERRPDVMMFEEVWDQRRCAEPGRPAEYQLAPYACSAGDGHQLLRILPDGYSFGCVHGDRDTTTCVAFRDAVFQPAPPAGSDAVCDGRDCSALMTDLESECENEGAMAYFRGRSATGPTTLVVMHLYVDFSGPDKDCRAAQLQATQAALAGLPLSETIIMAGDFNLDPDLWEGPDVDALAAMVEVLGLERLAIPGPTHMFLEITIDLGFVRGWIEADDVSCETIFLDGNAEIPMIDHAFVDCRLAN